MAIKRIFVCDRCKSEDTDAATDELVGYDSLRPGTWSAFQFVPPDDDKRTEGILCMGCTVQLSVFLGLRDNP